MFSTAVKSDSCILVAGTAGKHINKIKAQLKVCKNACKIGTCQTIWLIESNASF
jgi:hypothetical protein